MIVGTLAGLLVFSTPVLPDGQVERAIGAFDRACLSTAGNRAAFIAVSAEQGWVSVNVPLRARRDWSEAFGAPGLAIMLNHTPASSDGPIGTPEQLSCSVTFRDVPSDWRSRIEAATFAGAVLGPGQAPSGNYRIPPGLELVVWDRGMGRIHATHNVRDNYLEISINYGDSGH